MHINDFEVQTTIGHGGFGEVLMAISKKTHKVYAIKVMNKEKISREGKKLSIYREKSIMKFLSHENIAKLEASFTDKENIYLLMELVEGDDLGTLIEKYKTLDVFFARYVVEQLVKILDYMHNLGLYHADIKPQNIMLTLQHKIKLVDFGCAGFFEVNERNKNLVTDIENFKAKLKDEEIDEFNGTRYYASPELLETGLNHWQDDLWSLGVVLYEMLTGTLPFDAPTEHLTFQKITKIEYNKQPKVA
jgi:serine/threonine protein kinase